MKPQLFIGSATETEKIAKEIAKKLCNQVQVCTWRECFPAGQFALEALQKKAAECDFAVFVCGKEDTTISRGKRSGSPRDNVIYEAGLFAGALGRRRVFIVQAHKTKIPTDYLGVTTVRFDQKKPDYQSIVRELSNSIAPLGRKPATRLSGHWWQLVVTKDDKSVVSFFKIKPKEHGRCVSMGGNSWGEKGQLLARWDALATEFDEKSEILHYSWEGKHPTEPGVPLYFGVGKIRYGEKPIFGEFSTTKRHQHQDPEFTRFKSAIYIPAKEGDESIMGYNVGHIELNKLVDEKLQLREEYAKHC